MHSPLISIVLPVYNGAKYLKDTINSLLNQTFTDFELLIINDGSVDDSVEIALAYNDPRIKLINNSKNEGIVYTLNRGFELATGEFIARMDADDIALPNRLELQINYLRANKHTSIIGSYQQNFGSENSLSKPYLDCDFIAAGTVFNNQICHPSVMVRKKDLRNKALQYKSEFKHTEDWVLWFDCMNNDLICENLPEVLIHYRMEGQNITAKNRDSEKERHLIVYHYILSKLFSDVPHQATEKHWALSRADLSTVSLSEIVSYSDALKAVMLENGYTPIAVNAILKEKKTALFYKLAESDAIGALKFLSSEKLISAAKLFYLLRLATKRKKTNLN